MVHEHCKLDTQGYKRIFIIVPLQKRLHKSASMLLHSLPCYGPLGSKHVDRIGTCKFLNKQYSYLMAFFIFRPSTTLCINIASTCCLLAVYSLHSEILNWYQNRHVLLKSLISKCLSPHGSRRCTKYRKCPHCVNTANFSTRSEIRAVEDGFDLNYSTARSTSSVRKEPCSIFLTSIQPSSVGDVYARI
jgi:hypothetical protein